MEQTRGVIISAFKKRGYIWSAFNLAFSIKHYCPEMHITILHDESFEKELLDWQKTFFDEKIKIPFDVLYKNGRIDPANVKISIYDFLQKDYNLFIDVDAKSMHNINVIFDELIADGGHYYTHIIGQHNISQGREIPTMYWAYADDIWNHYNLPDDAILPSTNSSFQFIKRCDESKKLFDQIRENYENPIPISKLRNQWGGTQPDELYLNIALAQFGMMPKTPRKYLWMGNEPIEKTLTWMSQNYPIMCLFGNKNMIRTMYTDYYNRTLVDEMRSHGFPHIYKWHKIKNDKHANTKIDVVHDSVYRDDVMVPPVLPGKVKLIVPFYKDKKQERNNELIQCLINNIACKNIDKIVLICDDVIPEIERMHQKVEIIVINRRQKFSDAVEIANQDDDTINIVSNTDIYFDERNIQLIKGSNLKSNAFALSRYDIIKGGTSKHFRYEWSQDVWIWQGKLNIEQMKLDVPFGKPYCDSLFSYELGTQRNVVNPSFSIKTYHLHLINSRNYNESERLKGNGTPVPCETVHKYLKKRLLLIQPGKVGDIVLCLPIAKFYSNEFIVDWKCPKQYHSMFKHVDYVRPVESGVGGYDKTIDIAFGLGGAPEQFWQQNKHNYNSFVTLKYELAGVPIEEKTNLMWIRNEQAENELYDLVVGDLDEYVLVHSSSDYGTPIDVDKLNKIEFKPIGEFTIFDWYKVIINASEIHCIDSSLCNFIDAIPEAKNIVKYYHKTDKVPNKYDETILSNNWTRK